MAVASIFTELDIDLSKFKAKQETILKDIELIGSKADRALQYAFQKLGVTADQTYQMMANLAIKAYEKISASANASAAEQIRAKQSMIAKLNAMNMELAKSPAFEGLGIRSAQAIATEMQNTFKWYAQAKEMAKGNANELVRIEDAKNAKIISLENELGAVRIANNAKAVASAQATANAEMALMEKKATAIMSWQAMEREAYAMNNAFNLNAQKATATSQLVATNAHYATLGMKSAASINEQKANIEKAAFAQQAIIGKSSEDWIRIERAKNDKLKELNKEMTGEHEMSMASMQRAVLRYFATFYIVNLAVQKFVDVIMSGVKAIDEFKINTIAVAAQIASMQGPKNVVENYKQAVKYAEALNIVLMQVDANSFANYQEIQLMNRAATAHGVILDVNNQKQIEGFTAITNTVRLLTTGQNKEIQASQEINALVTGRIKTTDRVAQQIDGIIKQQGVYKGGLKEVVKLSQKNNDLWERLAPYLVGITAASADISSTWESVSSSLETAWGIVQRGLFKDLYKDLTTSGREAVTWMKKNADDIVASINTIWTAVKTSVELAIIVMGAFAIASWAAMIKAGDATAWFALRWEQMTQSVTLATSKMVLGWYTFIAAILGFSFGTWISDNFELARQAGVAMVYGIADKWDWLVTELKVGWEYLKSFGDMVSAPYKDQKAIADASMARIAVMKQEYEERKELRDKEGYEQFKAVTDQAIAENKARIEAAKKAGIIVPKISPSPDALTKSMKDELEILQSLRQEHKAYYDEVVKTAEQTAKLSQRAGEDEFQTIKILYDAKEQALRNYRTVQWRDAEELVKIEAKQAAISEDGKQKEYHADRVLHAKKTAIHAIFMKELAKIDGERAIAIEDANIKQISLFASFYKTIGDYSEISTNFQIAEIQRKYKEDGRWAQATSDQRILMEKAMNVEIFNLKNKQLQSEISLISGYVETVYGVYNEMYKTLFAASLENQANLLEEIMKNANKTFDKEAWITAKMNEELAKRLDAQATYYDGIKGYEEEALKARLAAIKLRGQSETILYNDKTAAEKKVADETLKSENKVLTTKISNIQEVMKQNSSAFESLSQLYAADSSNRKTLHDISMAFAIAEKAAMTVNAVIAAVEAVATQGKGEPYTAFARIAAMIATMASLLSTIGVGFSGSASGSSASMGAAYGIGTTTLGGANNQGSESINNTWKLLEDTYDLQKRTLTGIYENMKQLNANITGIVKAVVMGGIGNITGEQLSAGVDNTGSGAALVALGLGGLAIDKLLGGKYGESLLNIPIIGPLLGSVGSFLMGGSGGSQSLTASGLNVSGGKVTPYQEIYTAGVNPSWGGLFGGGSDPTLVRNPVAIDPARQAALVAFFYGPNGVSTTVSKMFYEVSGVLGKDADKAKQTIIDAFLKMGDIDLMGLKTDAEIESAIKKKISEVEDIAARSIFGEEFINKYIKTNEAAAETVMRLYIDLKSVTDILGMTGKNATSATIDLSESLIDFAGGLDKLQSAADTYYDKFFLDSEKQAYLHSQLTSALALQNMVLPTTRALYRDMVEQLDLSNEVDQKRYVLLLQLSDSADKYYTALGDVLDAQNNMIKTLTDQSKTIKQWLIDMNLSPLAPSNSMQAVQAEYNRQKGIASASGASTTDVSNYLNYAKEYLDYMKKYGGDYKAIYAGVMGDVGGLKTGIDLQLDIAQKQLDALNAIESHTAVLGAPSFKTLYGLIASSKLPVGAEPPWSGTWKYADESIKKTMVDYVPGYGPDESLANLVAYAKKYHIGGYASGGYHEGGARMVGEFGPEIEVTPPSRIFNNKQTRTMIDSLGLNGGSNGPGGEVTVHTHIYLDGKEVAENVAKHIPRNGNLSEAIRRAMN